VSLLAFTDGKQVVPMVPSCDYKRACDHDEGPNTGGMGCYSPPGFFDQDMVVRATECAVRPVIRQLAEDGVVYRGVVYAGLMVDGDDIKVLEFNARFGDPETQVVLPRLESDLAEVMLACVEDRLDPASVQWKPGCAVAVVLASGGYPGLYSKGYPILGLDRVDRDVNVFHAGTCMDRDGEIVTDGGRVLAVVSAGASIAEARERVYTNVARLSFTDMMYRTDIALREVA
jgi:phosphoribosylamine--glycine ligase